MLAQEGFNVVGLDPAKASLDIAKSKKYSDKVQWVLGDASSPLDVSVDMAVMTGNVAQVFINDFEWNDNLKLIRNSLNPEGNLVFEVRDPVQKAWENWTPENTRQTINIPNVGVVEGWCELKDISGNHVTFVWTYVFEKNKETVTSESTLCFREKEEIIESLENVGYAVEDIRDAPDRPNQEFVFIAKVTC